MDTNDDSLRQFSQAKMEMSHAQAALEAELKSVQSEVTSINERRNELAEKRKTLIQNAIASGMTIYRIAKVMDITQSSVRRAIGLLSR